MYGMVTVHPYPMMPSSVRWLLYCRARSGWRPLRPGGTSIFTFWMRAPVSASAFGRASCRVNREGVCTVGDGSEPEGVNGPGGLDPVMSVGSEGASPSLV